MNDLRDANKYNMLTLAIRENSVGFQHIKRICKNLSNEIHNETIFCSRKDLFPFYPVKKGNIRFKKPRGHVCISMGSNYNFLSTEFKTMPLFIGLSPKILSIYNQTVPTAIYINLSDFPLSNYSLSEYKYLVCELQFQSVIIIKQNECLTSSLYTGKPSAWCLLLAKGFRFMTTPIFRVNFNAGFQWKIFGTCFRTLDGIEFINLNG